VERLESRVELFRAQAGELVVALPEAGIDLAWLARPLAELGLHAGGSFAAVRVGKPRPASRSRSRGEGSN